MLRITHRISIPDVELVESFIRAYGPGGQRRVIGPDGTNKRHSREGGNPIEPFRGFQRSGLSTAGSGAQSRGLSIRGSISSSAFPG